MPPSDSQFAAALRLRRERAGLTQPEAAKRLGIPFRTYQNYEGGTSAPPSASRRQILLEKLEPTTSSPGAELLSITGGGTAASGPGRTNDGEPVERIVISTSEIFRVTGLIGPPLQSLRWFINVGDSNEPEFKAGERIYYLESETFTDAGFYVVELDGERVVKRVQRHGGGAFTLIPVNPDYERERFQPLAQADTPNTYRSELSKLTCTLRVIGKVLFNLHAR